MGSSVSMVVTWSKKPDRSASPRPSSTAMAFALPPLAKRCSVLTPV
jgi:hypothetical protein